MALLNRACRMGDNATARALLDAGVDPNAPEEEEEENTAPQALHLVCFRGNEAPQPQIDEGYRPLHLVCFRGNEELVDMLLHYGADPNIQNGNGETPMFCLTRGGVLPNACARIARKLLERGALPNVRNGRGKSLLFAMTAGGFDEAVEVLLQSGADPNFPNKNGETAIHISRTRAVVQTLIRHGADPNHQTNSRTHPLLGPQNGRTPLLSAFIHFNRGPLRCGIYMCEPGPRVVEALLEGGADPYFCFRGVTMLHIACLLGDVSLVETFLRFPLIDINQRSECGHMAINFTQSWKIKNLLIRRIQQQQNVPPQWAGG